MHGVQTALSPVRSARRPSGASPAVSGLQIVSRLGRLRRLLTVCRRNPPIGVPSAFLVEPSTTRPRRQL